MLTLTLFRHAKSSRDDPALADIDRPLAPRGETQAPRMGAWARQAGVVPDLVLCSSSLRTRQTYALAFADWAPQPPMRLEPPLYHASPAFMLGYVRSLSDAQAHVMLIGHNPGLNELAVQLAGQGPRADLAALADHLPTAAIAVITFDVARWADVRPGAGTLARYMTPKRLPA